VPCPRHRRAWPRALRELPALRVHLPAEGHQDHPGEIPSDDPWAKVEKRPKAFDIDMIRCIYCGMCEEVCPEQAISCAKTTPSPALSRKEMVHDKKRLYEIGGQRVGLVNKWNELK
jgi:NADH-quinone oxidoreductase subunit I